MVYEKNKNKVIKLKKIFPKIVFAKSENEIFLNKQINLVSIASYDDYHFNQIIKCLNKNIHVIAEKPLCLTLKELNQIKKRLKTSKSKITSNMVLRVNDLFKKIKHSINPKNIYYMEGDYLWGRKEKLSGWRSKIKNFSFTLGAAIHIIDLICWILNEKPISVISFGNKIVTKKHKFKKESFIIYIFKFKNKKFVKITANMVATHQHFHDLKIFSLNETYLHNCHSSIKIISTQNKIEKKKLTYKYPDKKNRKKMIQNFIDYLLKRNTKRIINNNEIFDVMSICLAADKSLKNGKEITIKY